MMKGYQLVVAACLYELINTLILTPEVLDLEDDERLRQWWMFHPSREGLVSLSPCTDRDSTQAQVIACILAVMRELRVAKTWPATAHAISHANHIGDALWPIAVQCITAPVRESHSAPSLYEALRVGAIERLSDYFEDYCLGKAYELLMSNRREETTDNSYVLGEDPLSRVETHVDSRPMLFPDKQRVGWTRGIQAAVTIAMNQLTPSYKQTIQWNNYFEETLGTPGNTRMVPYAQLAGEWPSQNFGLKAPTTIDATTLIGIERNRKEMSSVERLEALIGQERCIMEGSNPMDVLDFPSLLAATASELGASQRVELVKIKHPVDKEWDLVWYSFAMRKAAFSHFSNHSRWRVFYKAYADGPIRDSEHNLAEKLIKGSIEEFSPVLNVIELEDIETADLLDQIEPRAWRFVLQQAKKAVSALGDQRGKVPELLASALLGYWNCERVRPSLEIRFIKKEELDAIGICRSSEGITCIVLETKGEATRKQELIEEIRKFKNKLRKLKQALPNLSKEVSFEEDIQGVRAIFVSMARLEGFENDSEIEIWDIDRFVEELRKAGVPPRLRDMLNTPTIPFTIDYDDAFWAKWTDR